MTGTHFYGRVIAQLVIRRDGPDNNPSLCVALSLLDCSIHHSPLFSGLVFLSKVFENKSLSPALLLGEPKPRSDQPHSTQRYAVGITGVMRAYGTSVPVLSPRAVKTEAM
jgi:hypothetical protein